MGIDSIEAKRRHNMQRQVSRALHACSSGGEEGWADLIALLAGPHAMGIALAIMDDAPATANAVRLKAPLGDPFGGRDRVLLYLVNTYSSDSLRRMRNLLAAGWGADTPTPGTLKTALMYVCTNSTKATRTMAEILINGGADIYAKDVGGNTAMDYAPLAMKDFMLRTSLERDEKQPKPRRATGTDR